MDLSNENVIHIKKDNIEYLQFKRLLELGVKHAYGLKPAIYNTKPGITSEERYNESINNYKKLCNAIDVDFNSLVKPRQEHTDVVESVDFLPQNAIIEIEPYECVDGLVTNIPNCTLASTNADCILLLLYDPVKKVIANVHSGWKGTFQKIGEITVKKMIKEYNCNPKDMIACICPSIRKCHFKVRTDVKDECEKIFKYTNRLDEIMHYIEKDEIGEDSWLVDTVLINKILLTDCGLKEENIIDSEICSVCSSEMVHSYRVEGKGYGLSCAIICL